MMLRRSKPLIRLLLKMFSGRCWKIGKLLLLCRLLGERTKHS